MEEFVRNIYLMEINGQCDYALRAASEINDALKSNDTEELFRAAHNFLTHTSNVSRLLWPAFESTKEKRKRAINRAKELRDILGLPDDHLLNKRTLRNHLEHYDTRIDDWVDSSPNRIYIDKIVGSRNMFGGNVIQDRDIMRHFDPSTFKYTFRSEEFEIKPIVTAIEQVAAKVKAIV